MAENGIIKGMTPTTFEPEGTLTRGQVATLLYRMAGEPEVTGKTTFTDVPEKAWYATAIAWAQQEKIVNGTSETTFEPEGAVTRAQLVTMLYRMAGEPEVKEAATFKDLKADWYKNAVAWAEDMKVVNGTTETTFEPEGLCTRAQAAKILSIYMTLK